MDTLLLLIYEHIRRYPKIEIQDVVKLLYQQQLGTGHAVPSFNAAFESINKEREGLSSLTARPLFESIGNNRYRLHLNSPQCSLFSSQTIAHLFTSQKEETPNKEALENQLANLLTLIKEERLPFSLNAAQEFLAAYRFSGYPPLHHSQDYKNYYSPAYRVVGWEGPFFENLLLAIEKRCVAATIKRPFLLAIDGRSGSGKSTLGAWLHHIYPNSTLLSMDEFFLPQQLKTPQRLHQPGGNVHHELLLNQVLKPLQQKIPASYTPFNCATQQFDQPKPLEPAPFYIIEGSYSLHPSLFPYYHLSVFLTLPPALQKSRILARSGPDMLPRFLNEWIPLEEAYFAATQPQRKVDFVYDTAPWP